MWRPLRIQQRRVRLAHERRRRLAHWADRDGCRRQLGTHAAANVPVAAPSRRPMCAPVVPAPARDAPAVMDASSLDGNGAPGGPEREPAGSEGRSVPRVRPHRKRGAGYRSSLDPFRSAIVTAVARYCRWLPSITDRTPLRYARTPATEERPRPHDSTRLQRNAGRVLSFAALRAKRCCRVVWQPGYRAHPSAGTTGAMRRPRTAPPWHRTYDGHGSCPPAASAGKTRGYECVDAWRWWPHPACRPGDRTNT